MIIIVRWVAVALCLTGIVTFYRFFVHANPTTVALTLLLLILFVAANWGLRYAITTSIAATICYNAHFFLPPVNTLTVSDPQNLLALIVFLITSVFASRLSDRIREESREARARQAELEVLYRLSRALLQSDELAQLTNAIPAAILLATDAKAVLFFLLEGDRIYRAGSEWPTEIGVDELREMAHSTTITTSPDGHTSIVPLKLSECGHAAYYCCTASISPARVWKLWEALYLSRWIALGRWKK